MHFLFINTSLLIKLFTKMLVYLKTLISFAPEAIMKILMKHGFHNINYVFKNINYVK